MCRLQREALYLPLGSAETDAMGVIALSLEQLKRTYFATFYSPKCPQGHHPMFYLLSKFDQRSVGLSKRTETHSFVRCDRK